ncbi:MAG: glucose-1-phosphate adenylyltransferase [Myxococcales bacterium]|nr:glucose-1-phosphate adenylyltransferase [Myxococcales bacterium]
MPTSKRKRVVTIILGGGRGTRLLPLTRRRAKPAVPLGGKYRLIDVPLSNCINSGLKNVFILTQFLSHSLHNHVSRTYRFDMFSRGQFELLAAEQTDSPRNDWYQGTADAVRKQLHHFTKSDVDAVLILSGDHLYRMDYQQLLSTHRNLEADVTVSTTPVTREACEGFGVLSMDQNGLVKRFVEKPAADEDISDLRHQGPDDFGGRDYLASMGIYVFKPELLAETLADPAVLDFGKDVFPKLLDTHRVAAHVFDDYWQDIGTIRAFYEANLRLTDADSPFRLYEPGAPIFTRPRFLPPSVVHGTQVTNSLISDGCLITADRIERSSIGVRSRIRKGAVVRETVMMGADYHEDLAQRDVNRVQGVPDVGIGMGCIVDTAIIDKNARIGDGCVIVGADHLEPMETENWSIVDGIVVVPKNAVIPPGTRIGAASNEA